MISTSIQCTSNTRDKYRTPKPRPNGEIVTSDPDFNGRVILYIIKGYSNHVQRPRINC